MKTILTALAQFVTIALIAQDNIQHWPFQTEYHYRAFYIDQNQDTLSTESILMKPINNDSLRGKHWDMDIIYSYSIEDSMKFAQRQSHPNGTWMDWTQSRKMIMSERRSNMGFPFFGNNQYFLTATLGDIIILKPFRTGKQGDPISRLKIPKIESDKGIDPGGRWKYRTYLTDTCTRQSNFGQLSNCWRVEMWSKSKKRTNKLVAYYNLEYGFIELSYAFFNGDKAIFILEEKINKTVANKP